MITVPASFREMPRWWHDEAGRAWLDRLPALVAGHSALWNLTSDGPPHHGSNALVVPVRRRARAAVLRLAPPGDDVATEATALHHWAGLGVVELPEVDGDLHHGQVLAGGRRDWTVVDPVLLRGDPECDLGRVLWTRLDELPDDADVLAALDAFVAACEVPTHRARDWVLVRSMSYLLWGLEQGLTIDPPRCRRLLDLLG